MKKAFFVSNPDDIKATYEHPWHTKERVFNSKKVIFEPYNGLTYFGKKINISDKCKKVIFRATALGIFELYVNGSRVGTKVNGQYVFDELKPTWTDYRYRVFEYEYDITDYLKVGENFVCAEVSPGWWSGRISFGVYGFKPSAFCGEIEISGNNGTGELIYDGWKTCISGPCLRADIWDGEYYDSRIKSPAYAPDAYTWNDTVKTDFATCDIEKPVCENIRVIDELQLHPVSAVVHKGTLPNDTDYGKINIISKHVGNGCEKVKLHAGESVILDFAQNMVGRPKIVVKAAEGTEIRGYFAELLNDSGSASRGNDGAEGSMYIMNYRSALARLVYIASGKGQEVFEPLHTFYGFRYFELCADSDVEILSVTGEVMTSDIPRTGYIETDNPDVNKLISNIIWGQRGNYLSVPTDCPQRDERLGWTGDTQIFAGAASYLCDIDGFMKKWLGDARHSQIDEDGAYCDVIPRVFTKHNNGNAAWGDAGIIVPWRLWLMYRDIDTLAEHYDSMEYYMQYLSQFGLEGPNTAYGDWLNYDVTDKRYIAVCYYACDAEIMAKISDVLGKADRAVYYRELFGRIKAHFAEKYIENGKLTQNTQTSCLLALKFDILPDNMRDSVINQLRGLIVNNNYTLSTGFVGTGILNQTLSELGLDDLCYSLLLQTADPSWLYSVKQGATTIWERWNSYTLAKGFGDVGMNSFNHYAYGAVAEWMFADMAGIKPNEKEPGFEKFILAPRPDTRKDCDIPAGQTRIGHVFAVYDSRHGRIESGWDMIDGKPNYRFTIPNGTQAEIRLICDGDEINVNGVRFTICELGEKKNGIALFTLPAGSYIIK